MALKDQSPGMCREDWLAVRATPPFSVFPLPMVRSLITGCIPLDLERGTIVFTQGELATSVFLILSGTVKISRITTGGSEAVLGIVRSCEIIGEAAMFCDRYYHVGAEVIKASRILRIEGAAIISQVQKKPSLALQILASASCRLKGLAEQLERMKCLSAEQRIADFFLQLCACRTGACSVGLPCDKQLIAGLLGITPQTFSRALARLRDFGVSVERDTIRIADVQRLSEFAQA